MSFYQRLAEYYLNWGKVLRGEAAAAAIFPNAHDVGSEREEIYQRFLEQHAPSNCNIDRGGFVFTTEGAESRQIDVLITQKNVPRFRLSGSKVFAWVHGLVGVVSVKSRLDRDTLRDALENLDSVPFPGTLTFPRNFYADPAFAAQTPFRVIYASSGISIETLEGHLKDWIAEVSQRPGAKYDRLPHVIHVAGQYVIIRGDPVRRDNAVAEVRFSRDDGKHADALALATVINGLHTHAVVAGFALPDFDAVLENLISSIGSS